MMTPAIAVRMQVQRVQWCHTLEFAERNPIIRQNAVPAMPNIVIAIILVSDRASAGLLLYFANALMADTATEQITITHLIIVVRGIIFSFGEGEVIIMSITIRIRTNAPNAPFIHFVKLFIVAS